jgi:ankyrin repeat protein
VAKKALMWVIFGQRPLTLKELAVAIALDPDDCEFEKSRKLDDDEQILEICGSFVRMDEHTHIVEVAHFSVVEYFTMRILPGNKEQNPDFMDKMHCHAELLNCCLAYLMFPQFATGPCAVGEVLDRLRHNELLEYAALKWPAHREEVEEQPALQKQVCKFFSNNCKSNFLAWEQLWRRAERRFVLPEEPNGLFYALEFDCVIAIEALLLGDGATFADASQVYGNALLSVANTGKVHVVRMLLRANADLSVRDEDGWSALHFAAYRGWINIVEMLLDAKADASAQSHDGWTALHRAVSLSGDSTESVKMLLDAKADVSVQDKVGKTPLHIAAERGYKEIVKVLLDAKADVSVQDNDGKTPLHLTVMNSYKEIVKVLLDAKADVSVQDNLGRTALHWAALTWSDMEIVKMLLDAKADVSVQDNYGRTALHHAQDEEIVKLLLDSTADASVEAE